MAAVRARRARARARDRARRVAARRAAGRAAQARALDDGDAPAGVLLLGDLAPRGRPSRRGGARPRSCARARARRPPPARAAAATAAAAEPHARGKQRRAARPRAAARAAGGGAGPAVGLARAACAARTTRSCSGRGPARPTTTRPPRSRARPRSLRDLGEPARVRLLHGGGADAAHAARVAGGCWRRRRRRRRARFRRRPRRSASSTRTPSAAPAHDQRGRRRAERARDAVIKALASLDSRGWLQHGGKTWTCNPRSSSSRAAPSRPPPRAACSGRRPPPRSRPTCAPGGAAACCSRRSTATAIARASGAIGTSRGIRSSRPGGCWRRRGRGAPLRFRAGATGPALDASAVPIAVMRRNPSGRVNQHRAGEVASRATARVCPAQPAGMPIEPDLARHDAELMLVCHRISTDRAAPRPARSALARKYWCGTRRECVARAACARPSRACNRG